MADVAPTLYTFSFCRSDAERIVRVLRASASSLEMLMNTVDPEEEKAWCWNESGIMSAIADDIEWKLPE